MNSCVLETKNLRKVYQEGHNAVEAVKDVSLSIQKGEVVAIIGPSGSGKTTLISMMGFILRPTAGSVIINGTEIQDWNEKNLPKLRLQYIGFVFQAFNLFPALTVTENVEISLNLRGIRGKKAQSMAQELLEKIGLGKRINFLPRDLSGGEKQRVSIARAIAHKPPIILADEPTGNLDSHTGKSIIELLRDLAVKENSSVLIVTHDSRVIDLTNRVFVLEDGRITKEIK